MSTRKKRSLQEAETEIDNRIAERREKQRSQNANRWNENTNNSNTNSNNSNTNNDDNNQDRKEYLKTQFKININKESDPKKKNKLENFYSYLNTTPNNVNLSKLPLCINPNHTLKYYGHSIFIACELLGGDVDRFKQRLGIKNTEKLSKKNKKKKKPEKKYQQRQIQSNKLKKPQSKKSKPKTFTDAHSKQYAKFNRNYKTLSHTNSQNKTTKPSEFAFKSHINKCSNFDQNDIKIILSGYSQPYKIITTAYYVCKYLHPNKNGEVQRQHLKDYGPMIYDGTWNIEKPIINPVGSWLLLKYKNIQDINTLILFKPLIKLLDDWVKWPDNIIHARLMKEVDEIIEENNNKTNDEDFDINNDEKEIEKSDDDEMSQNTDNETIQNTTNDENIESDGDNDEFEDEYEDEFEDELLARLKQYNLDEPHILEILVNRKRPVTLVELSKIPSEELKEYLKTTLKLDAIDIIRFQTMLDKHIE